MIRNTVLKRNALLATALAILVVSAAAMAMTINNAAATNITVGALESPTAAAKKELVQRDIGPAGAEVEHATADTFENLVLSATVPVLVDFHADWCGPCQIQDRILKEFAGEFAGGKIVKVDVDENPELAARYDVQALPTLLVFQDGHVVARQVGVATKQQLKAAGRLNQPGFVKLLTQRSNVRNPTARAVPVADNLARLTFTHGGDDNVGVIPKDW